MKTADGVGPTAPRATGTLPRAQSGQSPLRRAGYPVSDDAFNKAIGYLRTETVAVGNADYQSKAVLLHALAVAGQGDFTVANLLHRERTSLSTTAIAYLALALVEMDRKEMAGDVLKLLAKNSRLPAADEARRAKEPLPGTVPGSGPGSSPRPAILTDMETCAVWALAAEAVAPRPRPPRA